MSPEMVIIEPADFFLFWRFDGRGMGFFVSDLDYSEFKNMYGRRPNFDRATNFMIVQQ